MKKISVLLLTVMLLSMVLGVVTYGEESKEQLIIRSTDWMSALPDGIKITDLNIPGVHDAAMAHSTAVAASGYTLTQKYYIGNTTYEVKSLFGSNKVVTEPGLLEQGVRYFDIRLDYEDYDPTDEDDVYERNNYLNNFSEDQRPLKLMEFAGEHLVLCHGVYNARYLVGSYYEWNDWEDITNLKLMQWIKVFLDKHPDETIILDISAEDEDKSDKENIASIAYDFFNTLATYGGYGVFPEIYVGDHVPTLGECRGKMVILTDMPYQYDDYTVSDPVTGAKRGHWAFMNGYSEGDAVKMDFRVAKTDTYMKSKVYKNNRYNGIPKETKWTYVKNGLDHADKFRVEAQQEGYDAFMLLYCSENRVLKGGPRPFAEYINPLVNDYIINQQEYQYYGIIVIDFANDESVLKDDIVTNIFATNFQKDYAEYETVKGSYTFSSYTLQPVNSALATASVIGEGNPVIIVGTVILLGVIVAVILIGKKKKQKAHGAK